MTSPLELLANSGDRKPSYLSDKWNPLACATLGFTMACFSNWILRRPPFSGIQIHVLLTIGGGCAGAFIDKKRNDYFAEKDATLRDYIRLHPDDFPTPERKKYADILERWVPIR